MAAKYQLITELYRRTGVAVAKNPHVYWVPSLISRTIQMMRK